ncbi:replicative DNA helicase, partial [Casaltella massiliensis]|nr:replicative DNA helicase [Casaltella massiliensis]
KQGHLEDIGGISYITSLSTIVPTTSNVKYYADIVKEKSVLRKLIRVSNDILNLGYDSSIKVEDILEKAEKQIFDISQEKSSEDFQTINSVLMDTYD